MVTITLLELTQESILYTRTHMNKNKHIGLSVEYEVKIPNDHPIRTFYSGLLQGGCPSGGVPECP